MEAVWWPTTVSRQKQKPSRQKQNTSRQTKQKIPRQNQILHGEQNDFGFAVGICFCRGVFGFLLWSIWFCREVFGFAVRFLVLSWGILILPWGFCFCREVFGFAVRFLVFPWQLWATVVWAVPQGMSSRIKKILIQWSAFTFKRSDIQLRKNPFTFDFNSVLTPNLFRDPEPGTKTKVPFQFNMSWNKAWHCRVWQMIYRVTV